MSKSATWMPLYIGDYLADTGHLTAQQHGSYLLMLMHQWRTGPLPDDERQLASIARVDIATWRQKIAPTVRAFFCAADGGLTQKRLTQEKQKSDANSLRKSEAGQRGAEGRWSKTHSERNGTRMADALPSHDFANVPSPSPSERKKEGSLRSPARARGGRDLLPQAMAIWNETCVPPCTGVEALSKNRRALLSARLRDDLHNNLAEWRTVCERVRASSFLTGGGDRGWVAGFDWLIKAENMLKTIEGRFDNRKSTVSRNGHAGADLATDMAMDLLTPIEDQFQGEPANAGQSPHTKSIAMGYKTEPPDGWWEDAASEIDARALCRDPGE